MPEPDGGGQILERNNNTYEAVRLSRVVGGTHFEDHLLLLAQVERLHMAAAAQVPNVHLMSVFAAEKEVRLQSAFDHIRCAPFACEQRVESKMPPEIVMKELRSPVHFRLAKNVKCLAIEQENATRAISIGRSKRTNVNAFRAAVNRVRT